MYVCIYVYMYIYICMYVFMYICILNHWMLVSHRIFLMGNFDYFILL